MDLTEQRKLAGIAKTFFDQEMKVAIDDARNRYNMVLADYAERESRDLSCLPSTKSTAVVDKYVESSIDLYESDPDAYEFVSRSVMDPMADMRASWLTEIFKYRKQNCGFDWFTWHMSSLTNGGVDGLEAGFVWWRKEGYSKPVTKYFTQFNGQPVEIPQQAYADGMSIDPSLFYAEESQEFVTDLDTFWIDSLVPGVELLWDPKITTLNLNTGSFAVVKLPKSYDEYSALARRGIVEEKTLEQLRPYLGSGTTVTGYADTPRSQRTINVTSGAATKDTLEFWTFFSKENGKWLVQHSIRGELAVSEWRPVMDVYFGGEPFNILPVVLGTYKPRLWKAGGRSYPMTIAPLEDQHIDHINNVNDLSKQIVQGRYRIDPDSDVKLDDVINARAYYAESGEVERITLDSSAVMATLRVDDGITMSMNEIIPVGMGGGRGVVPKGTDKTLGAVQLGLREGDAKLGAAIRCRNETFIKPLLRLIIFNIVALDTDQKVLAKAAMNAGIEPPIIIGPDGIPVIDHRQLDSEVDITIHAGLGAMPRATKVQNLYQISQLRTSLGVPTDNQAICRQVNILSGFGPDQFDAPPPPPPPPPPVDYKATINIDLVQLPPAVQMFLLQTMMSGGMGVTAKIDGSNPQLEKLVNSMKQNGGGSAMPERGAMGEIDATGPAAMGMSMGGMQNAQ